MGDKNMTIFSKRYKSFQWRIQDYYPKKAGAEGGTGEYSAVLDFTKIRL
jgi:hypothetical protein